MSTRQLRTGTPVEHSETVERNRRTSRWMHALVYSCSLLLIATGLWLLLGHEGTPSVFAQITGVPHVARMAGSDAGRLWRHPQFEALYDHVLRCAEIVIAAGAVATRAIQRGVDPDLLQVRGAGPLEPLQADISEVARSANRRVSFSIGIEEQP